MSKDEFYLFELSDRILDSLDLLHFDESSVVVDVEPAKSKIEPVSEEQKVSQLQRCSTCNIDLGNVDLRERSFHFKSDIHRLNLKRGLNGLPPLTETEFDDLLERQSLESISGSEDSDSEDEDRDNLPTILEKLSTNASDVPANDERHVSHMNTRSPYVLLKSPFAEEGKVFGVYKAVFTQKALDEARVLESLRQYNRDTSRSGISVLLMIGGGHFAGAVISHQRVNGKGNIKNRKETIQEQKVTVLQSKTFHRYTTRRKQGGSQSASDNARGKANSAGSSIRRYNEQALQKDVRDLLELWRGYISEAQHVFIRANGASNRKILVGYENAVLKNDDARVKSFPFTTKRATLSEVKSAWVKLTYLANIPLPKVEAEKPTKLPEQKKIKSPEPVSVALQSDIHTRELIALLKKSKAPLMINYLKKNDLGVDFTFTPESQYANAPTALHFAALQGLHHMVRVLLQTLKADPTIENTFGKTAAQISSTSQTKYAFQIARHTLGESFCEWQRARVGPARSSEEVAKEEEQQKKHAQELNKKLIEEELAKKTELELKKPTISSNGRLGERVLTGVSDTSGLTDQQKMRLMREQRARAAEARMKQA